MTGLKEQNSDSVINVIDEFDYSTQSDSYNKRFIAWRKEKSNPYAFNYSVNGKESVFIDGKGFVNTSVAEIESVILGRLLSLIGASVLIMAAVDNVFQKLFIQLLDLLGVNVHESFYNSVIYGGCTEVTAVLIVVTSLKLLIPLIFLRRKLRMPVRLAYPLELKNGKELILAIAAALIISVITSIPRAYSEGTKELFEFFRAYNTDVSMWGQQEFLIYSLFDIIAVPILFECIFRGSMFTALRQFGDVYAVIISSVISGLVMNDPYSMLVMMLVSYVAAVGALRSGTIYTAIVVHVINRVFSLALALVETSTSQNMYIYRNLAMVAVFVAGVVLFAVVANSKGVKHVRGIAKDSSRIPLAVKLLGSFKVLIFSAAVLICLIAALVNL
ncbi:MAG: CPBP family intramembrane metalloprotease [Oscillospiraceae bacterium]|nr:CPBP family intramembrane metalloprotease [Oscillospiraceae bacterium]